MDHTKMPRLLKKSLLACLVTLFAVQFAQAQEVDVDKTCASCSRRKNDSLNLQIRKIRLNQVGYLPQDNNKAAFVADPSSQTFTVVNADTRQAIYTGTLKSVGEQTEGEMVIKSYYNSITVLDSMHRPAAKVNLHRADFSALKAPGTYVLACGKDTSATFQLDPKVYNFVFETSLKFFGVNRCGNTHSWIHGACHLKDGDALGPEWSGKLAGGWHDCGDHGKYSATEMYPALILPMTYALWPEKAEDFYGASYNDTLPFGTDGIPDILYEAKVGADYILALYKASKAKGLIAKGDMYHSVGSGPGMDHLTWDVPERQDALPQGRGGPARPVTAGIGSNVAGVYAASLAFFAWGWEPFDPALAKECLAAAKDIYDNIVMVKRKSKIFTDMPCCYTGGASSKNDDELGLAAFALWFATKESRFRSDLLENPAFGTSPNAIFNDGEFPTGIMAATPFHHGGWTTDYENYYSFVLYGLVKLILGKPATAAAYGVPQAVADSLKEDCIVALSKSINDGSNGNTTVAPGIHADHPYHGVFTSVDWGFNRYNLGLVQELFMYWDLTGDQNYYNIGIDNLNYNLGMNPWDISFIMGAGEKNLQHPHNRAANPEGLNTGGFPYPYRSPKGALMGGCHPKKMLMDYWQDYVVTETCIDFSAQLIIPTQMLAQDLPPDNDGPKFRNVVIFPEDRTALVTWSTDEISRDTLVLLDGPGGKVLQTVAAEGLARNKQVNLLGLTPSTTYYVYFKGMDIRRNRTEDRNSGAYWKFTTKASVVAAQITNVKVCNETHESALVTWWTRNGYYPSQVDYGKTPALGLSQSPDDTRLPTQFHRVTLKQLEAATPYYFQAVSGSTKDDNGGKLYQFSTTQVLVDYTIRIKPTSKASGGKSTHFYIDLANNEDKPYYGLELRFYFTADAATAAGMVAVGYDNQIFDAAGNPHQLGTNTGILFGAARQVQDMPDQWYFPITINDTLPVSGRARFELQINIRGANNTTGDQPFSFFEKAWSARPHAQPPDPVPFQGIDLAKGATGVYKDPEIVVNVNGKMVVSYVENPYITAYYKGIHVYGYGPDYLTTDKLVVRRTATLALSRPVASPQDRLDLRQEEGAMVLAGMAASDPDGRIDEIVINGETLPESQLKRAGTSVEFSRTMALTEGTNIFDVIAWDTAYCAVETRKLIVNWIKAPPPPPPQVAKPVADPAGGSIRDSAVVALVSTTSGSAVWYTLDGSDPSPGSAGTVAYLGPIKIKENLTLKAVAVKPDWLPSAILEEKYEISRFAIVNIKQATFRDADADGHADAVVILLDTAQGAPVPAIALLQAAGAKLSSGLEASRYRISGDTLILDLRPNALWVQEGKETVALPRPAAEGDGMLKAGTVPIKDGVAPVIRRAVLRKGVAGAPDSLQVFYSEALSEGAVGPTPILALRASDKTPYAFALFPGKPSPAGPDNLFPWLYVIQSTPAIPVQSGSLPISPAAGDSVWIHALAGIADVAGNVQANPANARVPLRIWTPLIYSVESVTPGGVTHIPLAPQGPAWTVNASPEGGPTIGTAPSSLPVSVQSPDRLHSGGLVLDATHPFSLSLYVHDNLGHFVSRVNLVLSDGDLLRLPAGPLPGTYRLYLLWNGSTDGGGPAATGAYVYVWKINFLPGDGPSQTAEGKRIFGMIRNK